MVTKATGRPRGRPRKDKPAKAPAYAPRGQFERSRAAWEAARAEWLTRANQERSRVIGRDYFGAIRHGDAREFVDGRTLEKGLRFALEATGDPVFADAAAALASYGLTAAGSPRERLLALAAAIFSGDLRGHLIQMRFLLDRSARIRAAVETSSRGHGLPSPPQNVGALIFSVRAAAAQIAAEFNVGIADPRASFASVVDNLIAEYGAWREAGFPEPAPDPMLGDLGYRVHVAPAQGVTVLNPDADFAPLPATGAAVRWRLYWRHLFAEGSITARRLPD